jgi:hypothetical protein
MRVRRPASVACVAVASVGHIQDLGERLHVVEQGVGNGLEGLFAVVRQQAQVRPAAVVDDTGLVYIVLTLLASRDRWTLAKEAHQQKDVGEATLLGAMPMSTKGFRSNRRTSRYSTPYFFKASAGRSPALPMRLGRMPA